MKTKIDVNCGVVLKILITINSVFNSFRDIKIENCVDKNFM